MLPYFHLIYLTLTFPKSSVAYLATVAVRAALYLVPGGEGHQILARIIDVTQVSTLGLSLLTNVLATSIISVKAWYVCGHLQIYAMNPL